MDTPAGIAEDPELSEKWHAASDAERLRTVTSVADLVAADAADPTTPDHFEIEYNPIHAEPVVMGLMAASVRFPATAAKMRRVADLLRSWGWSVVEASGWENRGVRTLFPSYVGPHHTGSEVDVDRVLRDGRADLSGPLCNYALHWDETIVLMAAGTANHFGVATIDNDEAYGIECTGPRPLNATGRAAFPYRAYVALCVAIRVVEGWPVGRIVGHKETARPDGRKPDPAFEENEPGDGYPSPYPEMDRFRNACRVDKVLKIEEDDMPSPAELWKAPVENDVYPTPKEASHARMAAEERLVFAQGDAKAARIAAESAAASVKQALETLGRVEELLTGLTKPADPAAKK